MSIERKYFAFFFIGVVSLCIFFSADVQAATFSVSPASATFSVGDTITATILLDTTGAAIDGADVAYLTYDPSLLQVIDENTGIVGVQIIPGSLMTVNPANGNLVETTLGKIRFSQVTSGGTTFTSVGAQTLATVRFTVLAQGTAVLSFASAPGSTIDSNVAGSNGMDFLTSASGASYSLITSTKFQINDRVQVSSGPLNVRSCAGTSCSLIDTQATGALGTIIGGPTFADGSWWWNINYDLGADGWSVEDFLVKYVAPFDFSLSNEGNKSVGQGQSVTNQIIATLGSETSQAISFSTTGLPAEATYTYSPLSCNPTCQSVLTINTLSSTPTGTYPITVTGSNGTLSRDTFFSLTVSDITPPTTSSVQATNITANSATITWTTNEPADSRVDYGLTSALGLSVFSTALETAHSLTLTGLSSNTTYYYQVRSKDAAGNETVFTIETFKTLPAVILDTTPPAQIADLRTTQVNKFSAYLAWTAPGDDGSIGTAASYDIRYAKSPLSESTWNSATQVTGEPVPMTSGSTQTYKLVGLKRSTQYWVGIKAMDEVPPPNTNISLLSNVITFKTLRSGSAQLNSSSLPASLLLAQAEEEDIISSADVTQFRAKGVNTQIILFWKNPTDPDYVRTLIVRKEGSQPSTSPQDGTKIYEGTNEMFTDINLANGMSYSYTAFTFDEIPNYSRGVSVTASPNQNVTSTSSSAPSVLSRGFFTRLLARGVKDSDVRQLQQFLISQGYLASGNDTGYFGALTEQALKDFQCKRAIVCNGTAKTTGWGVFGPKTRSLVNQLFGQNTTPASLTLEQQQQLINSLTQQVNMLMQQLQKLLTEQGR